MKVGRIKDPLYKDYYLGISHLPSSHLLRPPTLRSQSNGAVESFVDQLYLLKTSSQCFGFRVPAFGV